MFIRQGDCNFRCSESSPSKGKVMMASIDVGEGGIFSFRFFFFSVDKMFRIISKVPYNALFCKQSYID